MKWHVYHESTTSPRIAHIMKLCKGHSQRYAELHIFLKGCRSFLRRNEQNRVREDHMHILRWLKDCMDVLGMLIF